MILMHKYHQVWGLRSFFCRKVSSFSTHDTDTFNCNQSKTCVSGRVFSCEQLCSLKILQLQRMTERRRGALCSSKGNLNFECRVTRDADKDLKEAQLNSWGELQKTSLHQYVFKCWHRLLALSPKAHLSTTDYLEFIIHYYLFIRI